MTGFSAKNANRSNLENEINEETENSSNESYQPSIRIKCDTETQILTIQDN